MKTKLAAILMVGIVGSSQAQALGDFEAGIGYMDRTERLYGFGEIQGTIYEGPAVAHKLGLEYIGYDETLDALLGTDIKYSTLVVNYEVELKMSEVFSLYAGAGVGGQKAGLDSPVGELDDDLNGYAQIFAGVRANLSDNFSLRAGVRQMYFQDYELLGVSGIEQENTLGFDVGVTFRF